DRLPRHYRRNCVLIHQLRMRVPTQQNTEVIEPSNNPLKLDAIDEKNRHRCLVFPDVVQENVLNVLRFFRSHGSTPTPFLETSPTPSPGSTTLGSRASATGAGLGLSCTASPAPTTLPNSADQPSCWASRRSSAPVLLLTTPRKIPSAKSPRSNSPQPGSGLNR